MIILSLNSLPASDTCLRWFLFAFMNKSIFCKKKIRILTSKFKTNSVDYRVFRSETSSCLFSKLQIHILLLELKNTITVNFVIVFILKFFFNLFLITALEVFIRRLLPKLINFKGAAFRRKSTSIRVPKLTLVIFILNNKPGPFGFKLR